MKKIVGLLAIVMMFLMAPAASAQIQFGLQGGANFSSTKIKGISSKNAAGWYIGPTVEMVVPIVGFGIEGSVWYSRVSSDAKINNSNKTIKFDYLAIPLNLKYKLQLPVITPFAFAGPEFQFKIKDNLDNIYPGNDLTKQRAKNYTVGINAGFGVELFDKLQVSLAYNWGVSDALKINDSKQRSLRLGLGYYF